MSGQPPDLFVVVAARRTGTNLLRELLNTNPSLAMLGEVLTPSSAPGHFANFLRTLGNEGLANADTQSTSTLLDKYFSYIEYRIRNFWIDGNKPLLRAIGVDIKYDQLLDISPANYVNESPFIIEYLRQRNALIVHTVRNNIIHSAISDLIARQRNLWHNHDGKIIDESYHIEPRLCLSRAREIVDQRAAFERTTNGCRLVECRYEDLVQSISEVAPGAKLLNRCTALGHITEALCVPFEFRDLGRLHKAINIPYRQLIANFDELAEAVRLSEFACLAQSLF